MKDSHKNARKTLHAIYDKHRRNYRNNPDSEQMCCLWSTSNPPDTLLNTQPICDIEEAFDIEIDEQAAMEIYDMTLDEAIKKIMEMKNVQVPWGSKRPHWKAVLQIYNYNDFIIKMLEDWNEKF